MSNKEENTQEVLKPLNDASNTVDGSKETAGKNQKDKTGTPKDSKFKRRRKELTSQLLNGEGEGNINNIKDLFKSVELNGQWFKHNILFIFTLTVCLLIFVTNRYQAQQELIEEARLKRELAEAKYKWLTRFSELTTSMRQSYIEERLKQEGDTTLVLSKEPPIIIKAEK